MTTILSYHTPDVTVKYSNIFIDAYRKHFSMTMAYKEKGKRKFTERTIEGTVTKELADWCSILTPEIVKIKADNEEGFIEMKSGRSLTGYQKYLKKRDLDLFSNPLYKMVFTSDNNSEDYYENPFKLVCYEDGRNTLSLVRVRSKEMVERIDTTTGEIHRTFKHKTYVDSEGKTKRSYIIPKYYRRLIIQKAVEVELMD